MSSGIDRAAISDDRQRRALQELGQQVFRRRVFSIDAPAMVGGEATSSRVLFQLKKREVLMSSLIIPRRKWEGAGLSSLQLSLGLVGNTGKYQTAFETLIDPGNAVFQFTAGPWVESVDEPVDVLLTASGNVAVGNAVRGLVTIEVLIAP